VTITQVVANLGAITGGILVGFISEVIGRRISMIAMCICAGAVIYPYTFTSSHAIIAAAFFGQFFVQGAFGVIPGHLSELSPRTLRAFVVGTAYQLGNLASSASPTIEAQIGERFPLDVPTGAGGPVTKRYDYATVICIFSACGFAFVALVVFLGPERKGINLDHNAEDLLPTRFAEKEGDPRSLHEEYA
jgi:SHS family lactate transporter-like MFS transporter